MEFIINTYFYKKIFYIIIFSFYGIQTPFVWGMLDKNNNQNNKIKQSDKSIKCPLEECTKKWKKWDYLEILKHFCFEEEIDGHYKDQLQTIKNKRIVICDTCKNIYETYDIYFKNSKCFLNKYHTVSTWKNGQVDIMEKQINKHVKCPFCDESWNKYDPDLLNNIIYHFCNGENESGHYIEQSEIKLSKNRIGFCLNCKNIDAKCGNSSLCYRCKNKENYHSWTKLQSKKIKNEYGLSCRLCSKNKGVGIFIPCSEGEEQQSVMEHIKKNHQGYIDPLKKKRDLGICYDCKIISSNITDHIKQLHKNDIQPELWLKLQFFLKKNNNNFDDLKTTSNQIDFNMDYKEQPDKTKIIIEESENEEDEEETNYDERNTRIQCTICSYMAENSYNFVKHLNEKHPNILERPHTNIYGVCLNPSCCKLYKNIFYHKCENSIENRKLSTLAVFCQSWRKTSNSNEYEYEHEDGDEQQKSVKKRSNLLLSTVTDKNPK
jgi:hypothetical protein